MIPLKKQPNADAINEALACLEPGRRQQTAQQFAKIANSVLAARAQGTTWSAILAALKAQGLVLSIGRIKKLLSEHDAVPFRGQGGDSAGPFTSDQPAAPSLQDTIIQSPSIDSKVDAVGRP